MSDHDGRTDAHTPENLFGQLALRNRMVSAAELAEALRLQRGGERRRLGEVLQEMGVLADHDVALLLDLQAVLRGESGAHTISGRFERPALLAPRHFGRYEVLQVAGAGRAGLVYRARDPEQDRTVALKVLLARSPYTLEQLDEAALGAAQALRLDHPHLLPLYETGQLGDKRFIAAAWCAGGSVAARIQKNGPLPASRVRTMARKLAGALAQAHSRGIVHGDVRAENVLLGVQSGVGQGRPADDDEPRLADLGTGLPCSPTFPEARGMPGWLAPECFESGPSFAGDQYALGALIVFLLKGLLPHPPNAEELAALQRPRAEGANPPAYPRRLAASEPLPGKLQGTDPTGLLVVAARALDPDPERRFPGVATLLEAL